jgi:hypothetical protein
MQLWQDRVPGLSIARASPDVGDDMGKGWRRRKKFNHFKQWGQKPPPTPHPYVESWLRSLGGVVHATCLQHDAKS